MVRPLGLQTALDSAQDRENRIDSHRERMLYRFSKGIVPEDGSLGCWLLSDMDDDYHWERLALHGQQVSQKQEYTSCMPTVPEQEHSFLLLLY